MTRGTGAGAGMTLGWAVVVCVGASFAGAARGRELLRVLECAVFVDLEQLGGNVLQTRCKCGLVIEAGTYIVVPAKEDQEGANGRGHEEQPVFGKDVFVEAAGAVVAADLHLAFESVTIKRREVEI